MIITDKNKIVDYFTGGNKINKLMFNEVTEKFENFEGASYYKKRGIDVLTIWTTSNGVLWRRTVEVDKLSKLKIKERFQNVDTCSLICSVPVFALPLNKLLYEDEDGVVTSLYIATEEQLRKDSKIKTYHNPKKIDNEVFEVKHREREIIAYSVADKDNDIEPYIYLQMWIEGSDENSGEIDSCHFNDINVALDFAKRSLFNADLWIGAKAIKFWQKDGGENAASFLAENKDVLTLELLKLIVDIRNERQVEDKLATKMPIWMTKDTLPYRGAITSIHITRKDANIYFKANESKYEKGYIYASGIGNGNEDKLSRLLTILDAK